MNTFKSQSSHFSAPSDRQTNQDRLHSKLRSSVLKVLSRRLSDYQAVPNGEDSLTNSIILEYFDWIGYHHSADMLRKETKLSNISSSHEKQSELDVVRNRLRHADMEVDMPLIFRLIFQNKQ